MVFSTKLAMILVACDYSVEGGVGLGRVEVVGASPRYVFHWPVGTEEYGPLVEVDASPRQSMPTRRLLVAYGFRTAFGVARRRILVFRNEAEVLAEFTGVDEWSQNGMVATFLRREGSKKYLRWDEQLSSRYADFEVVDSTSVITGAYAPRCFAVIADEADVHQLVAIAIARAEGKGAAEVMETPMLCSSAAGAELRRPSLPDGGQAARVARALLDYRIRHLHIGGSFTGHVASDAFVRASPFAFLVAACIDRGARAEAVWRIPFHLNERLGHLDPRRLSEMGVAEVEAALRQLEKRPRFPRQAARTIVSLSRRIVTEFDGDAARIWRNREPLEVVKTLLPIWGVGPGIAHMTVRILKDEFGYQAGADGWRDIDVKADAHVVRVFYRTGLARGRTPSECIQAARHAHPDFPGELDWATWVIGRSWCHESRPHCDECTLHGVCRRSGT